MKKKMTIKGWNMSISAVPPTSHDDYVNNGFNYFVLFNDEVGQNIMFETPSDAIEAIKAGLYMVRDKFMYYNGRDVIGFNSNDDDTAPWNFMNRYD